MKKIILLAFAFIFSASLYSQSIINGNFENWGTGSWEDPDTMVTSNPDALIRGTLPNATKTTDKQNGNYAVRLDTKIINGFQDTLFGYIVWGKPGNGGVEGGMPYSQKPTTINGYYKCNIVTGDTAVVLVIFKKNGAILSQDFFGITGIKSTYTAFSFNLTLGSTPDTVIVGATSSVPNSNSAKNGSWIQFDNFSFGGTGITQQLYNRDFEIWKTHTVENPIGWATENLFLVRDKKIQAKKTTNKYKGVYALSLTTVVPTSYGASVSVTNGLITNNGYVGGLPFASKVDTVCGYYIYTPSGADTAAVSLEFTKNAVSIGSTGIYLLAKSTYTYFQIPFNLSNTPDTMRIDIASSIWPVQNSKNGSNLIIDEIQLKSAPLNTGIVNVRKAFGFSAYPNPASDYFNIDFNLEDNSDILLKIYDISGKTVFSKSYSLPFGKNQISINTTGFAKGTYFYNLSNENTMLQGGKMIIE